MENRGNVWVADAGCGARLARETKSSRFVTQISCADDLQGHAAPDSDLRRLVSEPHRLTTHLDGSWAAFGGRFAYNGGPFTKWYRYRYGRGTRSFQMPNIAVGKVPVRR